MIIFKTKDKKELEGIAESCAGEIDNNTFYKVYDDAMNDGEFPFLFIDLHKKPHHESMFRSRFDRFIEPDKL